MKIILPVVLVAIAFLLGRLSVRDRPASLELARSPDPAPTAEIAATRQSPPPPARVALDATPMDVLPSLTEATNRYPLHPKRVADELENQRAEYTSMFEQFGLAPAQIEALFQAFAGIHELAITAGESRTDLMVKKERFNADLRKLLSPENYSAWRESQAGRPAALEAAEVVRFNGRNGVSTPESEVAAIAKYIGDHDGVIGHQWHGVSDRLPEPLHGRDLMLPYLEKKLATLNRLLAGVDGPTGSTLSNEAKEGLRHYYSAQIRGAHEMLDFCRRLPP